MSVYVTSLFVVFIAARAARVWKLLRRLVSALRQVPSWNFQLWSIGRNTRMLFPPWPKNKLGDLRVGFQPYAQAGSTALGTAELETLSSTIWFANAEACHQIVNFHETRFIKDLDAYEVIMLHGPNIVASQADLWKRYRKASRSAFVEKSYALVWEETNRILGEWFETIQSAEQEEVEVDTVKDLSRVTLNTIASVGFGEHFPWRHPVKKTDEPTELSFSASVTQAVGLTIWRAYLPSWAHILPVPVFRRTKAVFEVMEQHFYHLIQHGPNYCIDGPASTAAMKQGSLLRGLLQANGILGNDQRLSDRELLANAYVFLLAGYETTAHTLAFVTAIFALYPQVHARVREEADKLWPNAHLDATDRNASLYKEDFHRLTYTQAVFNETMRHFPSEPVLPRTVGEDTFLPGTRRDPNNSASRAFDQTFSVPVYKGDCVVANVYALHMNPDYWGHNVSIFDPDRFLKPDWPKHAFMPFSDGPRGCIGRGFAIAEAVRTIATLAQDWDIRCRDSVMGMTWEARKDMLLRWRQEVTMVPVDIKLMFKKRAN